MKLITLCLDNKFYALDVMVVEEIIPLPAITPLARGSSFVSGLINLRGSAVPIIDLKERLGLGKSGYELDNDVLIVKIHDKNAGLIVDDVLNLVDVAKEAIIPPPKIIDGASARFMSAATRIGDDFFIILDIDTILSLDEKERFLELAGGA